MADIFISYSRDDRARVESIAKAFEAEGFSVWWVPEI
ncbi:MAG: TIR domain-containing protein [Geminicoccales bacterium]